MQLEEDRLNILLVATNGYSTTVVRQALEVSNTRCRLHKVGVGKKTLAYLRQEGSYADAPTPDLVLFDLLNAKANSTEVLSAIRADNRFRSLPVVLLTTEESDLPFDEITLGSTHYTTFSPVDLDSFLNALNAIRPNRFMQAISLLEKFGFVLVRMPELAEG